MRCCKWIVFPKSTRCEERSFSRIPLDPNETSVRARDAPTQYILAIIGINKELKNLKAKL